MRKITPRSLIESKYIQIYIPNIDEKINCVKLGNSCLYITLSLYFLRKIFYSKKYFIFFLSLEYLKKIIIKKIFFIIENIKLF